MIRVQNPGGVLYILSVRDDQRIFAFWIFDSEIFLERKIWQVFFGGWLN